MFPVARNDELIVVEPLDRQRALAMLSRNDIINAYHEALISNGINKC
jgi:hypothetical protein